MNARTKLTAALAGLSAMIGAKAMAATVQSDTYNPNGWVFTTIDGTLGTAIASPPGYSGGHVLGPSTPPIGTGSARLTVGADGADAVKLQTSNFNGTTLASIAAGGGSFSYSTFVTTNTGGTPTPNQQAPYLQIVVDNNGVAGFQDGVDDRLFFEPIYQNGPYSSVGTPAPINQEGGNADGNAPSIGVWETWDVKNGGFWTANGDDGVGVGGPPITTLASYLATHPNATIIDRNGDNLGVQVVAGFGGPGDWGQFDGNVDALTINGTTVNFEVPEPASLGLLALGGVVLARRSRKQRVMA